MAKNASVFAKVAVVLSLFLMLVVMAECRSSLLDGILKADSVIVCHQVIGVATGDDCTSISKSFKLSLGSFLAINPNINCERIFVGQWVCVDGATTS